METQVERIRAVCKEKGIAVSKLERDLGYGNGFLNPKKISAVPANRLFEIADYLGITPDYIVRGEWAYAKYTSGSPFEEQAEIKKAPTVNGERGGLSPGAYHVGLLYERANDRDRKLVDAVLEPYDDGTVDLPKTRGKLIPLFGTAAAAGPGEMDTGETWTDYEVPADSRAEFAVRVSGDSMEPELHDGQIALCVKRRPEIGDVTVVMVNGAMLVKQFITDGRNIYLRSLNRARRDADVDIRATGNDSVRCFGTVLLPRRPALVDEWP